MRTVSEAAKELKITSDTIHNWSRADKIKLIKHNEKTFYITEEDIEKIKIYLESKKEKTCKYCGITENKDNFIYNRNYHEECFKKFNRKRWNDNTNKHSESRKKVYQKDPTKAIARAKKRYYEKSEEIRKYVHNYYHKNKEEININRRLKKYDLTKEEYYELYNKNEGCCWICQQVLENPCIDHDHETGEVRGILCKSCNIGIGMLKDDIEIIKNAYNYLLLSNKETCINKELYCGYIFAGC